MKSRNYTLLFVYFLFLTTALGQKEYAFDYAMQIEYRKTADSIPKYYYTYTNSKDNSYLLTVSDSQTDSNKITFYLKDMNGLTAGSSMDKADFYEVEAIGVKCPLVRKFKNTYKSMQLRDYKFIAFPDTLIDAVAYKHYAVKCINAKKAEKENIGAQHYLVNKDAPFHLPVLLPQTAVYEVCKNAGNIPNGLYTMAYYITHEGKITDISKIYEVVPHQKLIYIDEQCDYTQKYKN
jgi:hypothetical protein